jgi:hypothetical protein
LRSNKRQKKSAKNLLSDPKIPRVDQKENSLPIKHPLPQKVNPKNAIRIDHRVFIQTAYPRVKTLLINLLPANPSQHASTAVLIKKKMLESLFKQPHSSPQARRSKNRPFLIREVLSPRRRDIRAARTRMGVRTD